MIFSSLFLELFRTEVSNKTTAIKIWMRDSTYCFFFSLCPINVYSMQIAFSWLVAFLQILKMCFSKFSFLSVSIPNDLTDDSLVNSTPFIFNTDWVRSFLELIIIDWNLSGFTIMLFVLNQYIAVSHSFRIISKSSV